MTCSKQDETSEVIINTGMVRLTPDPTRSRWDAAGQEVWKTTGPPVARFHAVFTDGTQLWGGVIAVVLEASHWRKLKVSDATSSQSGEEDCG